MHAAIPLNIEQKKKKN